MAPKRRLSSASSPAQGPASKRQQLDRRSIDEKVDRVMQRLDFVDKLKLNTARDKDGRNARERVTAFYESSNKGAKFTPAMMAALKDALGFQEETSLKVANKAEVISEELTNALRRVVDPDNTKRNVEDLRMFVRHCKGVNQREPSYKSL